jgi:hypothetical protein
LHTASCTLSLTCVTITTTAAAHFLSLPSLTLNFLTQILHSSMTFLRDGPILQLTCRMSHAASSHTSFFSLELFFFDVKFNVYILLCSQPVTLSSVHVPGGVTSRHATRTFHKDARITGFRILDWADFRDRAYCGIKHISSSTYQEDAVSRPVDDFARFNVSFHSSSANQS